MRTFQFLNLMGLLLSAVSPLIGQSKLVIDDRAEIISGEVESLLTSRLKGDSIELTYTIDFKNKCDYWFASSYLEKNELILTVKDCNEKTAGAKNLGTKIISAADSEKALLLYFALSEILQNPFKNTPASVLPENGQVTSSEPTAEVSSQTDPGEHRSRYFFAPSSYNLEEGELYYNTLYFLLHDVQYGVTDQFSIGMGTTVAGFPFYLTPKITLPVNDLSTFSIGDMVILGTWNSDFFGNLFYATYTRGNYRNNITIGGGHLFTREGEITNRTNSPVVNFSALGQVSDHIYFITENYASQVKTKQNAYYEKYDETSMTFTFNSADFEQKVFFIYGLTGFRFINRKKDVTSWQVGLTYLFRSPSSVPTLYTNPHWYTSASDSPKFITFPVIGYTRKFGIKY